MTGEIGYQLEEILRAHFLRAGFFVVRGVPVSYGGEELTDVDLWLYDRPNGFARRVHIVDIKYKSKPKAVDRLLWTKGLIETLNADGGYVATTDSRPLVRKLGNKLDLHVLDGMDLSNIRKRNILYPERLTDEELKGKLDEIDESRANKDFKRAREEILRALSEGFGAASAVRSLESFARMSKSACEAYPDSDGAIAAGRLAYLSAAIACQSIDYVSVSAGVRTPEERRELVVNSIRYGDVDLTDSERNLRIAVRLIEKYAPSSAARTVEDGYKADLRAVPAEVVADAAMRLISEGTLFQVGRGLEAAAYNEACPPFDSLPIGMRGLIGALLDYAQTRREAFAAAWKFRGISDPRKSGEQLELPSAEAPMAIEVAADRKT